MVDRQIDIGIITVIEPEFLAVIGKLRDPVEIVPGKRDVAVVRCLEPGNAESRSVAQDLIADLSPQWILLVGIAGGAASTDFTLREVIISSDVYDVGLKRNPAWTEYACRTAAAFARAFLRTRPCEPRSSASGTSRSGPRAATGWQRPRCSP
jgi:hypothetical protein